MIAFIRGLWGPVVAAVVICTSVTAVSFTVFLPDAATELTDVEARLTATRELLIRFTGIRNNLAQYTLESRLLDEQRLKVRSEVPDDLNPDRALKDLEELALKAGVTAHVTAGAPRERAAATVIPLELIGAGSYHAVAVLLDAVPKLKRIIRVTRLSMTNVHHMNGGIGSDVTIDLEIYANPVATDDARLTLASRLGRSFDREALFERQRLPEAFDDEVAEFHYDPTGKRDPFDDPGAPLLRPPGPTLTGAECTVEPPADGRPASDRERNPLERFDLDDLHVTYVRSDGRRGCAMVMTSERTCHTLRVGDFAGHHWAKLNGIGKTEVSFHSAIADMQTGRTYPFTIRIPVSPKGRAPKWFCTK